MNSSRALLLVTLLLVKHFVVDWLLQTEDEVKHKGTYPHPVGIRHSAKHALATTLVFLPFFPPGSIVLGLIDGVIHYHIDWLKQNLTRTLRLSPTNKEFWVLIGIDQLLHQLTYLALVFSQI